MSDRYKPVQVRKDHDTSPFIIKGGVSSIQAVLLQNGGRSQPLLTNTLLGKISASQKLVPYTNEAAVDGSALPAAIYTGPEIPAADLVAGDVTGAFVLLSDAWFDEGKMVFDDDGVTPRTFDTVITIGTNDKRTVRDHLRSLGLIPTLTETSSGVEN